MKELPTPMCLVPEADQYTLRLVLMGLKRLDLAPRAYLPSCGGPFLSKRGKKCFSNVFPCFSLDFSELSCRLAKDCSVPAPLDCTAHLQLGAW